ncbi:DNA polymerase IV 2 [Paenibacillus sp. P22]|nr:DNA polymerase IV 2 [Paenibacillus sp. P22]
MRYIIRLESDANIHSIDRERGSLREPAPAEQEVRGGESDHAGRLPVVLRFGREGGASRISRQAGCRGRPVPDERHRAGRLPDGQARGVTTASRVGEALAHCPELVVIRPRMAMYIEVSLFITKIFETYTDLVEPYSIDEQFLDVTGSAGYYGSPDEMARNIQNHIQLSTGIWSRVGIGPTKILAKMATDNYAKKSPEGVFELNPGKLESTLWTLPVHQMFMVASRMTRHFTRMGLNTIGDIARLDFSEFKRRMRLEMGKQSDIQAGYYWQTARGIDPSPVVTGIRHQLKSVSHGKALRWRLYRHLPDIEVVLLELVVEVCQRTRRHGCMGSVVSVAAMETDGERSSWFSRQLTLPQPTSLTHEVAAAVRELFVRHWSGLPVGRLNISLSG